MSAPVDVLAAKSFAGRGHARYLVVAGANPREKGIHDAAFGHYGITVAKVSFEHEYSHAPEVGADFAADYANRLVACADAMKGIEDPRAFVAAIAELIAERDRLVMWQREVSPLLAAAKSWMPSKKCAMHIREIDAALAHCGGES